MNRIKNIAIAMLVVFGLDLGVSLFIPKPSSLIITPIVVVLVLDWLWNRRKNIEYPRDENGTYSQQRKKYES